MLDCRVGYHPKLIEDWMTGFPESFNIIWVLKKVFFGGKKRTVSEVFYHFGSISYRFGSFFSALWDRLNQFAKLDQAIT